MTKAIFENIRLNKEDEKFLRKALSDKNINKVIKSRTKLKKRLDIQKEMGLSEKTLSLLNRM